MSTQKGFKCHLIVFRDEFVMNKPKMKLWYGTLAQRILDVLIILEYLMEKKMFEPPQCQDYSKCV